MRPVLATDAGARNYAEGTLEGRRDALKVFLAWAAERDLTRASQITRPILESYQRWLWRCLKANGQRLGWSLMGEELESALLQQWHQLLPI
jgi:integrase/recombinase XerD